ncbi:MAG: tRNA uracil 4-sulfurtransferase ThiI [Thermoproteota archaeon]
MEFDSVIIRFGGEIGIKGRWTRRAYERLVLENIKKVLEHYTIPYHQFVPKRGRIYIRTKSAEETAEKITRIFGVSSVSPAVETTSEMNRIKDKAVQLAGDTLKRGSRFAVRCRRVGKHPYSSLDICREVGESILTEFTDRNLEVDLTNPQVTIEVEVRGQNAYLFSKTLNGVGGFPLGAQARAVCLLSGGIDSAVACWLAMKRGCPTTPIYLDTKPFTDHRVTSRALDVARKIFEWNIGFPREVYIVPHGRNLETFITSIPRNLTCILCKRMMYRIAARIAEMEEGEGIITGEAIGEQASQTLPNLRVLSQAVTEYPIHRPLLGFNKVETEKLARKIGTFQISTRAVGGCDAVPQKPTTEARLEHVKKAEQKLDIEEMVNKSISQSEKVKV